MQFNIYVIKFYLLTYVANFTFQRDDWHIVKYMLFPDPVIYSGMTFLFFKVGKGHACGNPRAGFKKFLLLGAHAPKPPSTALLLRRAQHMCVVTTCGVT